VSHTLGIIQFTGEYMQWGSPITPDITSSTLGLFGATSNTTCTGHTNTTNMGHVLHHTLETTLEHTKGDTTLQKPYHFIRKKSCILPSTHALQWIYLQKLPRTATEMSRHMGEDPGGFRV